MLTPPTAGQNPVDAILSEVAGGSFEALWAGLKDSLSVIEGDVGGTEPDRFGALLRGYLVYLQAVDDSPGHFDGEGNG